MKIVTPKISDNKVGAVWYNNSIIATYGNYELRVNDSINYKGLESSEALKLIIKECKNDMALINAYDKGDLFIWPDFFIVPIGEDMIIGNEILAYNYDEAIEEFKEFINK